MQEQPGSVAMYVGEDLDLQVYVRKSDKSPQDVTGWSITMVLHPVGGAPVFTKTVGSGVTLTTPLSGLVVGRISNADTTSLKPGSYIYYFVRTDSGFNSVLAIGTLTLKAL